MLSALKTGGVTVELNEVHNVLIEVINFYEQKNLVNKYWLYSCQKKKKILIIQCDWWSIIIRQSSHPRELSSVNKNNA